MVYDKYNGSMSKSKGMGKTSSGKMKSMSQGMTGKSGMYKGYMSRGKIEQSGGNTQYGIPGKAMKNRRGYEMGRKSSGAMTAKSKKMMDNGTGVYSYDYNPMPMANQVAPLAGPGWNPDQMKANYLLQKAYYERDSLRGKSGM